MRTSAVYQGKRYDSPALALTGLENHAIPRTNLIRTIGTLMHLRLLCGSINAISKDLTSERAAYYA